MMYLESAHNLQVKRIYRLSVLSEINVFTSFKEWVIVFFTYKVNCLGIFS